MDDWNMTNSMEASEKIDGWFSFALSHIDWLQHGGCRTTHWNNFGLFHTKFTYLVNLTIASGHQYIMQ